MTTFTVLSQSEIAKRITRIKSVGARLQNEVHVVAVSCLAHARDHGDITLSVRLLDAMPNGQRVKALAYWFRKFSGEQLSFSFKPDTGWSAKLVKGWKPELYDVDGAYAVTFADLTAEKGYDTLSVKAVLSYLKRKADEDGLHPNGEAKVSPEAREFCAALFVQGSKLLKGPDPASQTLEPEQEGEAA